MMAVLLLAVAAATSASATSAPSTTVDVQRSLSGADLTGKTDNTDRYVPKGQPPGNDAARLGERACVAVDCYYRYGEASQHNGVRFDGARGYFTIEKPRLAAGDYHSLAELAVDDGASQPKSIVEIGWTVDRALNGDSEPHLFVYHWVDGQETCYNGCGFVPFNEPGYSVGMKLPVSSTPRQFSILHRGSEWLMGYNGHWVGAFPDALWGDRFKVSTEAKFFGEVASSTPNPCTDMGNGQPASSATAARVQDIGFWPGSVNPDIKITQATPNMYTVLWTSHGSFRYGGVGDCRTVPNLVGGLAKDAPKRITDAGLVVGGSSTVQDPECESLLRVISQSPAAGTTRVAGGSKVTYRYGVEPRNGCPDNRQ